LATRKKASQRDKEDEVLEHRRAFVEVVGTEISAIWRNVTRLGGQVVACLILWDEPRSMDDLAEELGRSKSNVFNNLKALESLGIVRRVRVSGSNRDHYELAGAYPDVLVVAFARHLSHTLADKSSELSSMAVALSELGDVSDAKALSDRVARVGETYQAAAKLIDGLMPSPGEPMDLISIVRRITPELVKRVVGLLRRPTGG
jgi:DNA-binding transcriptional regulator GbsR (MarR family)